LADRMDMIKFQKMFLFLFVSNFFWKPNFNF
jgi:hypothetical protein